MQIRVLDSSLIDNFPSNDFDSVKICKETQKTANGIASEIKNAKLKGWEVCFRFRYNYLNQILIYTRSKSDSIDKYKEITVHIPIPIKETIFWGVNKEQHIYKTPNHLDHILGNFSLLSVDYPKFDKCEDYVLDSMKRAIKHCFENGFKLNGVLVKQIGIK